MKRKAKQQGKLRVRLMNYASSSRDHLDKSRNKLGDKSQSRGLHPIGVKNSSIMECKNDGP